MSEQVNIAMTDSARAAHWEENWKLAMEEAKEQRDRADKAEAELAQLRQGAGPGPRCLDSLSRKPIDWSQILCRHCHQPIYCIKSGHWFHHSNSQAGCLSNCKAEPDLSEFFPSQERWIQVSEELLCALKSLRKSAIGLIWEPLGTTGDESDWFKCQLCGSRSRDMQNPQHKLTCPMTISQAAIDKSRETRKEKDEHG